MAKTMVGVREMWPYRNSVTQIEPTEEHEFRLKKTVFLAYTDIAAGGIRALLGITMKREYTDIFIPQLLCNKVSCVCPVTMDPRERDYTPVQIWNLKYEQFSVILVNTNLGSDQYHHVCSKIVDICTNSCIDKLVVLSALRVDVLTDNPQPIYENTINDMPLTTCPPLPGESRMTDPFLSTLIQMVQVDFVPTCILSVPAHRACHGMARPDDGSEHVIETFQKTINSVTKLAFDRDFSMNLIYKGDGNESTGTVSMMYS